MIFYDFEVFRHNWLVVFIEPTCRKQTVIIDNREELEEFYQAHKEDIWVGYNNTHYDQYILKGILCDFDPYEITKWIITKKRPGWQYSNLFRQFQMYNFDVSTGFHSLKQLEAFMGNDIKESSVPFNIDRKLTEEEIQETVKYCVHDVEQTIQVFLHTYKTQFEPHMGLIKAFDLPLSCISQTQTQLAARILGASRNSYYDEFDVAIPPTLQLSEKYQYIVDFFRNAKEDTLKLNTGDFKKAFYARKLNTDVAGVPHIFAWGGVHGALPKYVDSGRFIMADVASLYPSLMIVYGYYSRSITDPQRYIDIYHQNLEMKKTKDPRRPAYKLVCNKVYGALKAETNPLYDPLQANNICVAGQLLILDLIDKLEIAGCGKLIQSNTDGILVKIESDEEYETFEKIVREWEKRTGLVMEFSEFERVYQKDVNNYLIIGDGVKGKGAYVKDLNEIDQDLPIVNRAIKEYLLHGIHPSITIGNCNNMRDFQKVVKVSDKFAFAVKLFGSRYYSGNGEWNSGRWEYDKLVRLQEKTFRVFASLREEDGIIGKCKGDTASIAKYANTPDKCFIENGDVKNMSCPPHLDKNYYVDMAIKRIKEFGICVN